MQYGVLHGRAGLRGYVLPAERIAAVDKTGLQEGDCMAASEAPHRMQNAPSGTSWPQEGQVTMSGGHSHGRFRGMSTPWDAEGWFGSEE